MIATSRLTRGRAVKVVLIKEDDGSWLPLVSTDVHLSTKEILESYGKRFGIEEMFKDLKEVWGWGKQEVRNLESNEGVTVLNMTMYNMVELSTWSVSGEMLRQRSDCPWDDPHRRPSHEDRRKFLRYEILANKINAGTRYKLLPKNIRQLLDLLKNSIA